MYLLDTHVCFNFLVAPTAALIARFDTHFGQLAVSTITVAELCVGSQTSTDPSGDDERLNVFLEGVDVHDFDEAAATEYGLIVQSAGMNRNSFDGLIGAHALALGIVIVTTNERHFADVPGLKVENWTV
jgi:tRNA(fMet)-specific endonuclease VapC